MVRMKSRRTLIVIPVLLVLSGVYAWLQTPSYAVYQIQQSLKTRNYETFTQQVDIGSVIGYALEELGLDSADVPQQQDSTAQGSLAVLLQKGLRSLARNVQDIAKAGVEFAVQQAFQNPEQELPQIPTIAVIEALVGGETREQVRYFPVLLSSGEEIEIGFRYTSAGVWRVVRVTNVQALIDTVRRR